MRETERERRKRKAKGRIRLPMSKNGVLSFLQAFSCTNAEKENSFVGLKKKIPKPKKVKKGKK